MVKQHGNDGRGPRVVLSDLVSPAVYLVAHELERCKAGHGGFVLQNQGDDGAVLVVAGTTFEHDVGEVFVKLFIHEAHIGVGNGIQTQRLENGMWSLSFKDITDVCGVAEYRFEKLVMRMPEASGVGTIHGGVVCRGLKGSENMI